MLIFICFENNTKDLHNAQLDLFYAHAFIEVPIILTAFFYDGNAIKQIINLNNYNKTHISTLDSMPNAQFICLAYIGYWK